MDLARLEASETSRPVRQIADIDLPQAIRLLDRAAGLGKRNAAVQVEFGEERLGRRPREPLGIVVASAHWNAALLGRCEQAVVALENAAVYAVDRGATLTSAAVAGRFVHADLLEGRSPCRAAIAWLPDYGTEQPASLL